MAQIIDMSSTAASSVNENGIRQSFVTAWSENPEEYWKQPAYAQSIARTILDQICGSGKETFGEGFVDVLASWGVLNNSAQKLQMRVLLWRGMPAMALHVDGFEHSGWCIISLDEGADEYELELADDEFFAKPGSRVDGVICEQLAELIDEKVETGGRSYEEYCKMIAEAHPEVVQAAESGVKSIVFY